MLLLPLYKSENLVLGKKKNEHLGEFPSEQSICLCVCVCAPLETKYKIILHIL